MSFEAPGNSLPAIQLAAENDYFGIECDVQGTKDNQFFVIHDETLEHLTNGTGRIKEMTYEAIKPFYITSGANIEDHQQMPIPLLSEYLEICSKYNKVPVVEIKTVGKEEDLSKIVELIKMFG